MPFLERERGGRDAERGREKINFIPGMSEKIYHET